MIFPTASHYKPVYTYYNALAVEVGAQTHMLAAINDIEDSTLFKLREMVTDEVRRINGIINFESAVRYQRSEENQN